MTRFEKPEECIVCFEKFEEGEEPLMPCGHWVHALCIARWGREQCPLCRADVKLSEELREILFESRADTGEDNSFIFDTEVNSDYESDSEVFDYSREFVDLSGSEYFSDGNVVYGNGREEIICSDRPMSPLCLPPPMIEHVGVQHCFQPIKQNKARRRRRFGRFSPVFRRRVPVWVRKNQA